MARIRVYFFEGYDFTHDHVVRSRRPATAEFIERYHFRRIDDGARDVDTAELDAYGMLAGDS
jgi:hypothetical protein